MTSKEYLSKILEKIRLADDSPEIEAMQEEREKVEKVLREHFKNSNPAIRYGGSYKKGTMIKDKYDLDIICYFKHDDDSAGKTLEEIYSNVKDALNKEYYVDPKKSALRIESKEKVYFHIDVVPGRFVDDKGEDVFLYQAEGEQCRLKTNLDKHIKHISESGLTDIIKMIKYWSYRNALSVKTFILELLVVKILEGKREAKSGECLKGFWTTIRDEISNISIEDPANPSGNDLSGLFNEVIKSELTEAAKSALELADDEDWEVIFGNTDVASEDEKSKFIQNCSRQEKVLPKPWCM